MNTAEETELPLAPAPTAAQTARVQADTASTIDALVSKKRELTIGLVAIVAIGAGLALWRQGAIRKEQRAEQALVASASALFGGDAKQAQGDLAKMVTRYKGTNAGTQGAMMLAQSYYQAGKFEDGIKILQEAKGGASKDFASSIGALIGAGYADLKKYDESAKAYLDAANQARFPADRDMYKAEAARVYGIAGKPDDARKIWAEVAKNPESPVLAEAKIRIGEIDAAKN